MKIYDSPRQAKSLREIEAAAAASIIKKIKDVNGNIQPIQTEKEGEETGAETKAETKAQKARSKKAPKTV